MFDISRDLDESDLLRAEKAEPTKELVDRLILEIRNLWKAERDFDTELSDAYDEGYADGEAA